MKELALGGVTASACPATGPAMIDDIEGAASRRLDVHAQAFDMFNHTNLNAFVGNLRSLLVTTATSAGPARRLRSARPLGSGVEFRA